MPRTIQTAKGKLIDFDAFIIKQELANAKISIPVQQRQNFIDSKEGKGRGQRKVEATLEAAPEIESIVEPVVEVAPTEHHAKKK